MRLLPAPTQRSLAAVVVLAVAVVLGGRSAAAVAAGPNPVQVENAKPGSSGWEPLITSIPPGLEHAIEGYARQVSARPGDLLELCVSTRPAARYRIEILRLGWYDGCRRAAGGDRARARRRPAGARARMAEAGRGDGVVRRRLARDRSDPRRARLGERSASLACC